MLSVFSWAANILQATNPTKIEIQEKWTDGTWWNPTNHPMEKEKIIFQADIFLCSKCKSPTCLRHSEKRHSLAVKSESLREVDVEKNPGGDQNKRTKSIRNTMKHGVFGVKSLCLVQRWWCFVWIRSFSQCFAVLMVWKQNNSPNYSSDCLASGKGYHFGKAHIRNCTTGNFCRVG